MLKKAGILFLVMVTLLACAQEEAAEKGNDLTLNTTIAVKDLPVVGPVTLKQTQMFSGNIMRSVMRSSVIVGGEAQEISSTVMVNLDEGNIYMINDFDSNYVVMTLEEFDLLMTHYEMMEEQARAVAQGEDVADTGEAPLKFARREVTVSQDSTKSIENYGQCEALEFDLQLNDPETDFTSKLKGFMWVSKDIENVQLFTDFQDQMSRLSDQFLTTSSGFFGLANQIDMGDAWLDEINQKLNGVPVEADFEVNVPMDGDMVKYGISLKLEDYTTTDIDQILLSVPEGYQEVEFNQFRMY